MKPDMRDSGPMINEKDLALIIGLMAHHIKEIGQIINESMEKEFIFGLMAHGMKDNGKMRKIADMVF